MGETSFSDANTLNIFSGGSLLPGHTVESVTVRVTDENLDFTVLYRENIYRLEMHIILTSEVL